MILISLHKIGIYLDDELYFKVKEDSARKGMNLSEYFRDLLSKQSGVELGTIYHMGNVESATVSLDVKSLAMHTFVTGSTGSGKSNTVYQILQELNKQGICVRSGFHCAPLAHQAIGTGSNGAVRISFGIYNTLFDMEFLYNALRSLII